MLALGSFNSYVDKQRGRGAREYVHVKYSCTGCIRQNENHANFKIVKGPMLVLKQTIPQQKALYLTFNLTP